MTGSDALDRLRNLDTLLFCVGAQKAGTTWLHAQLRRHADFHFARKEFSYWSAVRSPYSDLRTLPFGPVLRRMDRLQGRTADSLSRLSPPLRKAVLAWRMLLSSPIDHSDYAEALLQGGEDAKRTGDFSPTYALLSRRTFSEMNDLSPNARFIFIMRDPVARLWSGVRHRSRPWFHDPDARSRLPLVFFEDAIEDPTNPDFRRSEYRHTIRALEDAVPADRILFLFFENLFTQDSADRIARFLRIDRFHASVDERILQGAPSPVKPTEQQFLAAREALSDTYDFVLEKFGDAVPENWRRHG